MSEKHKIIITAEEVEQNYEDYENYLSQRIMKKANRLGCEGREIISMKIEYRNLEYPPGCAPPFSLNNIQFEVDVIFECEKIWK